MSDFNILRLALEDADRREKSGMPAVGMSEIATNAQMYGVRDFGAKGQQTFSKYKESALANPSGNTLYGCTGLFGLCGPDEVIGLSMTDDKLLAWMGWQPSSVCEQFVKMITYMDVSGTADGTPQTLAGLPCNTPPNSEKGTAEIFLGDKGLYRVCGETVDLTKTGERKCDKQPTYTLPIPGAPNGVRIDNDLDFEAVVAAEALKHAISRDTITGDKTSAGEFDGLEQLIATGYVDVKTGATVPGVDPIVLNWANDYMDGTVNGLGSIITRITEIVRRIRQRVNMAGKGAVAVGDQVIVMPTFLRDALLDAWACYGLCAPSQYNELFRNNLDVRDFRDRFSVGLYGDGYITVDGIPVPIVTHDWMPIGQSGVKHTSDIYILTRRVGATSVLYGQYHPMSMASDVAQKFGAQTFRLQQGDRMLQWVKTDNLCIQTCLAIKPNMYLSAPWAQARITNVGANPNLDPLSNDPQSSYFLNAKHTAQHITQYFYKDGSWFH